MKLHIFSYKFIVIDIKSSKSGISEKKQKRTDAEKASSFMRESAHFQNEMLFNNSFLRDGIILDFYFHLGPDLGPPPHSRPIFPHSHIPQLVPVNFFYKTCTQ